MIFMLQWHHFTFMEETPYKEKSVTSEHTPPLSRAVSFFKEIAFFFLLALLIVVPIRVFIAQPYIVSGASMYPTFTNGDYLIVDQLTYRFDSPKRGDVIIFRFPLEPSKFFIKRVIGLPHETVHINNNRVSITPRKGDEFILFETYVGGETVNNLSFALSEKEYFVMGDNRMESLDSRVWGAVPRDKIMGRAFLRLFPITKIDYLPGSAENFNTMQKDATIE